MTSPEPPDPAPARAWQLPASPALLTDPIVQCFLLIVLTSVFFLLFPGVDPWFSGLFYDSANSNFPVSQLPAFVALRNFHRGLTWVVPIALVLVLLIKLAAPWRKSLVLPRDTAFILSTLAIGPGIVVNLIFKDLWGRPRPVRVDLFHGDSPFVGVWQITDYCSTNCSFVSGEASSAIWLLTLAVLLPQEWRRLALKILIGLAIALSLNRIAFGGHFLSDVLLAWWMTLAVIAVAWRILYVLPPAALTNDRMEAWLTDAGTGIRRLFHRPGAGPT